MYNKDLFASLGLQEPTTFNELLALCGKIRAAGKIPISAGFAALWGMFMFPADKAQDTVADTSTAMLNAVVSARTQHPKEAKTFVEFIARPKQNSLYAKVQGVIAGADFKAGIFPAYAGASDATIKLAKSGKIIFSPVTPWPRPDKGMYIPNFITQLPGLFTGQKTPADILAFMDTLWDRA